MLEYELTEKKKIYKLLKANNEVEPAIQSFNRLDIIVKKYRKGKEKST